MGANKYVNSVNLYEATDFPYLVLDVTGGGSVPSTAGFNTWHWHEDLQFVYALEGSVSVRTLALSETLKAGEGVFINRNVVHMVRLLGAGHYNSFIFPSSFLGFCNEGPARRMLEGALGGGMEEAVFLCRGRPWADAALGALSELSALEERRGEDLYFYEVLLKLNGIFLLLLKNHKPGEKREKSLDGRVRSFLSYIEEHYCEELSLDKIAAAASVSKSECLRSFKLALGTTPWRYLMETRLAKAAWMLKYTDEPVGWIASACGFSHQSYFGMRFREHLGCAPAKYRERARES